MAYKRWMGAFLLALAGGAMLFYQRDVIAGVRGGLAICGSVIIPSLFPFMALSALITNGGYLETLSRPFLPLTRLLRLPAGTGPILFIALVGGYPVAAASLGRMVRAGQLDRATAARMLAFSVNAGPAYLVGAVGGGMLRDTRVGWLLYASGVGASLILALVTRPRAKPTPIRTVSVQMPFAQALVRSVGDAAAAILSICAFVLLFGGLSSLLTATGLIGGAASAIAGAFGRGFVTQGFLSALFSGLLEVVGGCAAAAASGGLAGVLLIAALCGFGGLSVHCQVLSGLSDSGVPTRTFFLSRLPHALLMAGIFHLLLGLFPAWVPVYLSGAAGVPVVFSVSPPASIAMLLLGAVAILSPKWNRIEAGG